MNNNTIDVNEQIISLRENGLMQKEIAEKLSITRDKVRYILKKAGMQNFKYSRTCLNCEKQFQSTGHHARFCSDKCRRKHNKANNGFEQTCEWCNNNFVKYRKQRYCSTECYDNYLKENKKPTSKYVPKPKHREMCINCGTNYETHSTHSKYCSYECSYEYKVKQKTLHAIKCKECSEWFSSTDNRKMYCSNECKGKYHNRKKETLRRKRMKENGSIDWDISIERLIKRDRGICYLCRKQVNINVEPNHDYHPSIEHVVPIAKGGTHTWNNVKLAHRICNYEKSDNIIALNS